MTINIPSTQKDAEIDLTAFFVANPKMIGEKFYFTRTDAKKGDHTLQKGIAYTQVALDPSGERLYKPLGRETDKKHPAMTKGEIAEKPYGLGKLRMYIVDPDAPRYLMYAEQSAGGILPIGKTEFTIKFHGANKQTATLRVTINKG